jgi:hypothetical protein
MISLQFALIPIIAMGSTPKCQEHERLVWLDNRPFSENYTNCSIRSMGVPAKLVTCMRNTYSVSQLSDDCLGCFGVATQCGARNCSRKCMKDAGAPECLTCIDTHCSPTMMDCLGVTDKLKMPLKPTPKSTTGAPTLAPTTLAPTTEILTTNTDGGTTSNAGTTDPVVTTTTQETSSSSSESSSTSTDENTTSVSVVQSTAATTRGPSVPAVTSTGAATTRGPSVPALTSTAAGTPKNSLKRLSDQYNSAGSVSLVLALVLVCVSVFA